MGATNENRFVIANHRTIDKPCRKCDKKFLPGDTVISRLAARPKYRRNSPGGKADYASRRRYYHEECWEKLFL